MYKHTQRFRALCISFNFLFKMFLKFLNDNFKIYFDITFLSLISFIQIYFLHKILLFSSTDVWKGTESSVATIGRRGRKNRASTVGFT